jgi:hypothetical protein
LSSRHYLFSVRITSYTVRSSAVINTRVANLQNSSRSFVHAFFSIACETGTTLADRPGVSPALRSDDKTKAADRGD